MLKGKLSELRSMQSQRFGEGCRAMLEPSRGRSLKLEGQSRSHSYHKHHLMHRTLHVIEKVVLHVLTPISIGVAAGLIVSVIGMIVGQLVVSLWRTLSGRSHQSTYSTLARKDEVDIDTMITKRSPSVYQKIADEKSAIL